MIRHGDHVILQPGVVHRAAEERQRVHLAHPLVDHLDVVVLPPGLVLLRAAVVVDGEDDGAADTRGRAQVHAGLPAVRPDLQQRADVPAVERGVVQREALVVGHAAEQPRPRPDRRDVAWCQPPATGVTSTARGASGW